MSRLFRSIAQLVVAVPVTTALSGCATDASITAKNDSQVLAATVAAMNTCVAPIISDPKYQPLEVHIPIDDINKASLTQMSSGDYATPQDISLLSDFGQRIQPCRSAFVTGLATVSPSIAEPSQDLFDAQEQGAVLLAQQKITWGQFVSGVKKMNDESDQETRAAVAGVGQQLQQQAEQERGPSNHIEYWLLH